MSGTPPLTAAILVGGLSRRMGRDKATLTLAPDGPTVLETIVRTVATVAEEILLVDAGRRAIDLPSPALRHVIDVFPDAGPLGGIHAALASATHDHVLVVACDMPFLNADLLRVMASLPRDYDALVPLLGQPQPLHAIYARTALPLVESSLRARRFRVTGWFSRANVRLVPRTTIASVDPDVRSCFNMNTPDELAHARALASAWPV
ncbi:MAG: molybdenum cofactor guanylyltransferase [Thermomicrobiales bacterium]